jgi:hypothetical protein
MIKTTNLTQAIAQYLAHLQTLTADAVEFIPGRKFGKVVFTSVAPRTGRSVHSFVDLSTGDLLKAAGWAAPAKGARYNLVAQLETVLKEADPYGTYLYKR